MHEEHDAERQQHEQERKSFRLYPEDKHQEQRDGKHHLGIFPSFKIPAVLFGDLIAQQEARGVVAAQSPDLFRGLRRRRRQQAVYRAEVLGRHHVHEHTATQPRAQQQGSQPVEVDSQEELFYFTRAGFNVQACSLAISSKDGALKPSGWIGQLNVPLGSVVMYLSISGFPLRTATSDATPSSAARVAAKSASESV